jgi:predicted dehydrogenase
LSNIRYLASAEPTAVIGASAKTYGSPNVDVSTVASLALPNNATASLSCNMRRAWKYGGLLPGFPDSGVRVHCEMGSVELDQFIGPQFTHSIIVKDAGGGARYEEAYTFDDQGEKWWSRYMGFIVLVSCGAQL